MKNKNQEIIEILDEKLNYLKTVLEIKLLNQLNENDL